MKYDVEATMSEINKAINGQHPCACRFDKPDGEPVRYCAHHARKRDELKAVTAERDNLKRALHCEGASLILASELTAVTAERDTLVAAINRIRMITVRNLAIAQEKEDKRR